MRWLFAVVAAVGIGISAVAAGSVNAQPLPPPPGPTAPGSTTDELADMVMEVIQDRDATVEPTTPLPAPYR